MASIYRVYTWWQHFYYSVGIKYLCFSGGVAVPHELGAILIECLVFGEAVFMMHVHINLLPGAEGLVKSDRLGQLARHANAGECFPYAPLEYFPVDLGRL